MVSAPAKRPPGPESPGKQFHRRHRRVFEDVVGRLNNCNKDFGRLADVGYLELDETDVPYVNDREAYMGWMHDAWADFIGKMHGPIPKRPLISINDGRVSSSVHLTGGMRGKYIRARTQLTFHYRPLEWSESVYHWKVELKPKFV